MKSPMHIDVPRSSLFVYRSSCIAMLRRYFQMSVELGRLPALLGREFFRSRSDTIRESWFEDAVIYVHDIERCLECLRPFDKEVIARVVLQEHTQEAAAKLLGCNERYLRRRLVVSLDVLSQIFLDRDLMVLAKPRRHERIVEDLTAAAAGRENGDFDPNWNEIKASEWRSPAVEISCQAPQEGQINASC
jgi:hypothetical protein